MFIANHLLYSLPFPFSIPLEVNTLIRSPYATSLYSYILAGLLISVCAESIAVLAVNDY